MNHSDGSVENFISSRIAQELIVRLSIIKRDLVEFRDEVVVSGYLSDALFGFMRQYQNLKEEFQDYCEMERSDYYLFLSVNSRLLKIAGDIRDGAGMLAKQFELYAKDLGAFSWCHTRDLIQNILIPVNNLIAALEHVTGTPQETSSTIAANPLADSASQGVIMTTPLPENPSRLATPVEATTLPLESADQKPVDQTRPLVFISYSHKDSSMLTELQKMLHPMIRQDLLEVWSDQRIRPGELWKEEIERALVAAKVAVLLVSHDFLFSDFIGMNELPPLLVRAKDKGVTIVWVAVGESMVKNTDIFQYQCANDPSKPLEDLRKPQRNKALREIAEQIIAAAGIERPE